MAQEILKRPFVRIGMFFLGHQQGCSIAGINLSQSIPERYQNYGITARHLENLKSLSFNLVNPHKFPSYSTLSSELEAVLDGTTDPARMSSFGRQQSVKELQMIPTHGTKARR